MIGAVIDGHYRVIERIGADSEAAVYLAEDDRTHRKLVIKIMHEDVYRAGGERVARFLRQARALTQLTHPNIICVHNFATHIDGRPYCLMDHRKGRSFADVLLRERRLPWAHVVALMRQCCRAIMALHARRILHGELQAASWMLIGDDESHVVLMDPGPIAPGPIAPGPPDAPLRPQLPDSSEHLAPEQVRGDPIDERVDVYALGSLLYRALTGGSPFPGPSAVSRLYAKMKGVPPAPSAVAPDAGIPPALEAIVLRALAFDPAQRFGTVAALDAALARLPDERVDSRIGTMASTAVRPVSSPPGPPPERTMILDTEDPDPPALAPKPGPTVQLLTTAPRRARAGDTFIAKFAACHPAHAAAIRAMFRDRPGAHNVQGELTASWRPGAMISVRVHGEHLIATDPVHTAPWTGEMWTHDFELRVDPALPARTTATIAFDVAVAGVIVARVRLPIALRPHGGWLTALVHWLVTRWGSPPVVVAAPARTAFVSFDVRDADAASGRIEQLERWAGIRCWRDGLSSDEREDRKPRLREQIARHDLFLLLWSPRAAISTAVAWEWRQAMQLKGLAAMHVDLIDPRAPALPAPIAALAAAPAPALTPGLPALDDREARRIRDASTPEEALHGLLTLVFDATELRRWLALGPQGRELMALLPAEGAPLADLAYQAVVVWTRRALVQNAFFDRLADAVPDRAELIDDVRARWR